MRALHGSSLQQRAAPARWLRKGGLLAFFALALVLLPREVRAATYTTIIVLDGKGPTQTSRAQVNSVCTAGKQVDVTVTISGGAPNNVISGTATCQVYGVTVPVATCWAAAPGAKFCTNPPTQTQPPGATVAGCQFVYAGVSPQSTWTVTCLFQ